MSRFPLAYAIVATLWFAWVGCEDASNEAATDVIGADGSAVVDTLTDPFQNMDTGGGSGEGGDANLPGLDAIDLSKDTDDDAGGDAPVHPGDADADAVDEPDTCVPDCAGKECGPDGCGDICGTCVVGKACDLATGVCGLPNTGTCGDSHCDGAETCSNCAVDCGACHSSCGDGTCDEDESCENCAGDCGACPAEFCGDGTCGGGETCTSCVPDCGACPESCGNGTCGTGETCSSCPGDCGACPESCGNGICGATETCTSCPGDCGACPEFCGNGVCGGTETCSSCVGDCGVCPETCGNGTCGGGETCSSCPTDCGACAAVCGNGNCEAGETVINCPADCGGGSVCPGSGACTVDNGTPGCDDAECCTLICALDPFCCDESWDSTCVDQAADECPGVGFCGDGICGDGETCATCAPDCGPCAATCGDGTCNGAENCTSCPGDCGACNPCGNGICDAGESNATCPADCPGGLSACTPTAGNCSEPHDAPGCNDVGCCELVCLSDDFCCNSSWDEFCADATLTLCGGGNPACTPTSGSCSAVNGSTGCSDVACCTTVCDSDPFCCSDTWDNLCVGEAVELCASVNAPPACNAFAGDCFYSNGSAGCDFIGCCAAICADDPFCCATSWDSLCADAAIELCPQ